MAPNKENANGSITTYLQQKYVKQAKAMSKNGWDPEGSTPDSLEWWGKQKKNRTAYGTIVLITEHMRLIEKCDEMYNRLQAQDTKLAGLRRKIESLENKGNSSDQSTALACIPTEIKGVPSLYPDLNCHTITDPLYFEKENKTVPMAPMVTKIRGRGNEQRLHVDHVPLSLIEMRALLKDLPNLNAQDDNLPFWRQLNELQRSMSLHPLDMFSVVRAKCPVSSWNKIEPADLRQEPWASGPWANHNELQNAITGFCEAVKTALGKGAPKWHCFTAVVQNSLPFAEYADRKYEAFETHCGFPNPNRDMAVFTQQLLAEAAPHIQKVLAIGIHPGNTFSDIVSWASRLEEQIRKKSSTLHPIAAVRYNSLKCDNCGKTGHSTDRCKGRDYRRSRRNTPPNKEADKCFRCGEQGHRAPQCLAALPKAHASSGEYATSDKEAGPIAHCSNDDYAHLNREQLVAMLNSLKA
ncbi:uncharacterized protein LOC118218744 [Anguilla anguilla]|uniref:uncharacterized protein LOC118218744 n=1 Tax=Anguilla anguilla TaxID=7936 RepID=UPI0015ACF7C1|nr:uncharacterized protein LOC118218744 [Anguilla anguilla]